MKDCRGMALTEIMAGLVIMLILILAMMKLFMSSTNLFYNTAGMAEGSRIVDSLCKIVAEQITYADFLEVGEEEEEFSDGSHTIVFTRDGRIMMNGEALYGTSFYNSKRVYCQIQIPKEPEPSYALDFTIFLENSSGVAFYSARTVVKLVNLELAGRGGISYRDVWPEDGILDSRDRAICIRYRIPGEQVLTDETTGEYGAG